MPFIGLLVMSSCERFKGNFIMTKIGTTISYHSLLCFIEIMRCLYEVYSLYTFHHPVVPLEVEGTFYFNCRTHAQNSLTTVDGYISTNMRHKAIYTSMYAFHSRAEHCITLDISELPAPIAFVKIGFDRIFSRVFFLFKDF